MEALQTGGIGQGDLPPAPLATTEVGQTAEVIDTPLPSIPAELTSQPTLAPSIEVASPSSQATTLPTLEPTPQPLAPSATVQATFAVPTPVQLTNEDRWRAQQLERVVFPETQIYATTGSELWWYDPVNQQNVILGTFSGEFSAQARFILRGQGVEALEVPYQVNTSYGLTALSPALVERIQAAGYTEWIETYVFVRPNVTLR